MKNTKRVQKASSGLCKQGDLFVMWCEGGDGERYTSRPMDYEQARELLERWNRTAVGVASLHLSADLVERLAQAAEQWNRDVRAPRAKCLTWEEIAELVITTWIAEGEPLERLRRRPRPRWRARRSIRRTRRAVSMKGPSPEPGAAGG